MTAGKTRSLVVTKWNPSLRPKETQKRREKPKRGNKDNQKRKQTQND